MSTLAAVNLKNPSSATNNVVLATNGDLQFNSGYGSAATAYGCRAWVNFNGTGTVAIRGSGNVSSITDSDVGSYVVNFTNALSDTNYTAVASTSDNATLCGISPARDTKTTTAMSIITREVAGSGNRYDPTQVSVAIFR
jgi:hypothetical protein